MTIKYADRAFISVNGAFFSDLQSASLRQTRNAKVQPSITPDGFHRGHTEGNRDIDIMIQLANRNLTPRPNLEDVNFASSDVQITWLLGAKFIVATGIYLKDVEDNAPGVGEEAKTTFQLGAIRVADALGNPVLLDLNFG